MWWYVEGGVVQEVYLRGGGGERGIHSAKGVVGRERVQVKFVPRLSDSHGGQDGCLVAVLVVLSVRCAGMGGGVLV